MKDKGKELKTEDDGQKNRLPCLQTNIWIAKGAPNLTY